MKFLIIGSVRTPSSGAKIRSRNIAKYLAKAGHKVTLVELFPPEHKEKIKIKGVKIIQISTESSIFKYRETQARIIVATENIDVDYIIVRKPLPHSCKMIFGRKETLILDIDDIEWLYWKDKKRLLSKFLKHYEKKIAPEFDYITVTCPRIKEYVKQDLKVPEEKIIMLPNFLDLEEIKKIKIVKPQDDLRFLIYVASLGVSSDLIPILKVFRELLEEGVNVYLIVIGDGPRKKEYIEFCEQNDLHGRVGFLGYKEHSEVLKLISSADIALNYVYPKTVDFYRSPIKIREYLALGMKVVSNNVGDTYLFKDYIFMSGNSLKDFKNKIKLALRLERGSIERAKAGKKDVWKNYDGNKCIREFLKQLR